MDLRTRKYIKNTGFIPGYENGHNPMDMFFSNGFPNQNLPALFVDPGNSFADKYAPATKAATGEAMENKLKSSNFNNILGKGADVAQGALGLISMGINGSRPAASASDLVNNAKVTQGSIGKYSYDIYGDGGESLAMQQTSDSAFANTLGMTASGIATGASVGGPIGAAIGGFGGFVGGLFSGNKAKKAQLKLIRIAGIKKENKTLAGRYNAYTLNAKDKLANEYGDLELQRLIGAENGKRPVYGLNAWVSPGEIIGNIREGWAFRVPGKKNNKDNVPANLRSEDYVISNKGGLSDIADETGDYLGALNLQEMTLGKHRNMKGFSDGKPGFRIPTEIFPSMFNTYVGLDLIVNSKDQLSSPSSYRANRYEGVLSGLDDIDINMLPIYNNNRNVAARSRNAIVRSGGLGAGLIALALAANTYNTLMNDANALMNAQLQRNLYKTNAITTKYNAGAQDASRLTASDQWDYAQHAAAHNAAMQQRQMGLYNIANAWREGYKNMWDREQFEKMYGLYFQDMKNKEMYYNFLRNGGMDKPVNDLRYSKLRIDNNGLFGLRNTADTVKERSDQYYKYAVNPFSKDRLNSINIPQMSLQQLIDTQNMLVPGWSSKKSKSVKRSKK